jgi:phosphate transport system substrate-binding protein
VRLASLVVLLFSLSLPVAFLGCGPSVHVTELRGAGASFPAPLYQRWFAEYSRKTDGLKIEYASIGSGAGIRQFTEGLVDFGASDAAMTDEEMARVERGVRLLPLTAGAVVLCFNLSDTAGEPIRNLKLSRAAYAGILLGKITQWNDVEIADRNPEVSLPDRPISVVFRSDSSGTTFVLTQHLAAISSEWQAQLGISKSIEWPVGAGAPRNDGVAGMVKQADGSIGYVEYGYAMQSGIAMASLENKAGAFIAPSIEAGQAALQSVSELPSDLRIWLPDPDGSDAYPIVSYTWILCYETYADPAKLSALQEALRYCLTDGQAVSNQLGYIPLPKTVQSQALSVVDALQIAP